MLHDTKYGTSQKENFTENKIEKNIPSPIMASCATYRFRKRGKAFIGHPDHNQPKPFAPKSHWWGKIPTDNRYYAQFPYHFGT
jgi:hypothetical protein